MHVTVEHSGGQFYAVVENPRLGYRYIGEAFAQEPVVEGRFLGELKAIADAKDWVRKLKAAGLTVE